MLPSSIHRGRRVRRATSWALSNWSQTGSGSFTHLESETFLELAAEHAACSDEESSGLINDLHVWFRSFRVKLSRLAPCCAIIAIQIQSCFAQNSAKVLSHAALTQHLTKQLQRIRANRFANGNKFRNVDLSLMTLDHSDDRVRPLELNGEFSLGEVSLLACSRQHVGDRPRSGASKRLHDQCAPIY